MDLNLLKLYLVPVAISVLIFHPKCYLNYNFFMHANRYRYLFSILKEGLCMSRIIDVNPATSHSVDGEGGGGAHRGRVCGSGPRLWIRICMDPNSIFKEKTENMQGNW